MTDLRSELAWLVEEFDSLSHLCENEYGNAPRPTALFEADRKRAESILKMTDWQPIETAPKDEISILLWCCRESEGSFVESGAWSARANAWLSDDQGRELPANMWTPMLWPVSV